MDPAAQAAGPHGAPAVAGDVLWVKAPAPQGLRVCWRSFSFSFTFAFAFAFATDRRRKTDAVDAGGPGETLLLTTAGWQGLATIGPATGHGERIGSGASAQPVSA